MQALQPFQVYGNNPAALFNLKIHRGEGMCLLAMDWKTEMPPNDFVGFAIEYMEPDGKQFFALKNRIGFPDINGKVNPNTLSTRLSPIQKFRWVHFPWHADIEGDFTYRVSPVFMNERAELSYGDYQQAKISLFHHTYPGKLNVSFTRGFVASQAFVDRYESKGQINTLLPSLAIDGLTFKPSHPLTISALEWMGFEARKCILDVLDKSIADGKAPVYIIAYDLNLPEMVSRLIQLGNRLTIIIDDDGSHGKTGSAENQAAELLTASGALVKRQHMGKLQHNKIIIVDGNDAEVQLCICGSTNFSWRGFYVQNNNAIILQGAQVVSVFKKAFDNYWKMPKNSIASFNSTDSAKWTTLGFEDIKASICFSPHNNDNSVLKKIANDINKTKSSLFYSLAFLSMIEGPVREVVTKVTGDENIFVYGISDKKTGGFDLLKPDGNLAPVSAASLSKNIPAPFSKESSGGGGTRMHHKFIVADFDTNNARVYMGSYNFSNPADSSNGENLLLIRDNRIATAYMIEALRIFDHYSFRLAIQAAKRSGRKLVLKTPPSLPGEERWFDKDYQVAVKIKDRLLFSRKIN